MVLALALSSIGGVTYSWFSETETGSIEIGTGTANISSKAYADDVELEEDEQIKTHVLKTMYNDYTGYGLEYDDLILVPFGDWKSYLKDVANEFAQCLPDGFEDFVDVESLFNYMLKDTYYLVQAINMINKTSEEDYERYEKVDSGEVVSISYVIIREVI